MLYIVDQEKVYNAVDGKAVPVNVSAERNQFTGEIISYTIEAAGDPVDVPETQDIATVDEFIARFGCAERPYVFPASAEVAAPKDDLTRAELVAIAEEKGISVPSKATKEQIQNLIAEAE